MLLTLIAFAFIAVFTDAQVDHLILLLDGGLKAFGEAIKAVWILLSPALLGYVMWKQASNRRALDENTSETKAGRVESKTALDTANKHNEKIEKAVKISEQVLTKMDKGQPGDSAENPLHAIVENTDKHPAIVKEV